MSLGGKFGSNLGMNLLGRTFLGETWEQTLGPILEVNLRNLGAMLGQTLVANLGGKPCVEPCCQTMVANLGGKGFVLSL